MGRIPVRLVARVLVALCFAACATGVPAASAAEGGRTIGAAPVLELNKAIHGKLYDGAFYSGYSVSFWTADFTKGDRISIRTDAHRGDVAPCQLLYMPGTDDLNVGGTTPLLNPIVETQTRKGPHDFQRWETATETGTYILAMTNADIFLTGPHQCLSAPAGRPFTFKVTVARGSGKRSGAGVAGAGRGRSTGGGSAQPSTGDSGRRASSRPARASGRSPRDSCASTAALPRSRSRSIACGS